MGEPAILMCNGCDKVFNTRHGYDNHINKCKALIKVTKLEQELRTWKAVSNLTETRLKFYERFPTKDNVNPNYEALLQLLPKSFLRQCTEWGRDGLLRLCTYIYFAIPENRTVIHADNHKDVIWTWNGRQFKLEGRRDTIEMMLDFAYKIQGDEYDKMEVSPKKEKLEPWYNPRSKHCYYKTNKEHIEALDVFITDFYTRTVLPESYYSVKRKAKLILPTKSDDDDDDSA
jgi:uncharacterized C2H2 Zn-finger protein